MSPVVELSPVAVDADYVDNPGSAKSLPVLFHYWNIARRRSWLIVAIIVAALSAGLVMTLLATVSYSHLTLPTSALA